MVTYSVQNTEDDKLTVTDKEDIPDEIVQAINVWFQDPVKVELTPDQLMVICDGFESNQKSRKMLTLKKVNPLMGRLQFRFNYDF